ncbi:carbohydrate kinase [uncultured Parabacteroides sp.]|uniref:carbohydrate kinase family protein n=1 Tax=uncultured Parabacteroides sp. TaxID=512312 RepID=UPI0025E227E9|nr:carbohydrate kinase [uncultured Parabacteroides sp.]
MKQMQSNNKKPVVVGIGELLWDMLPTGKKAGGAPINFVYHASRLGAEGYAISAVGDDELGHEILKELDNNSIQYLIEKVPYPTGTVQVTLQNGIPDYVINERVAWDHLSPTSNAIDLAERADAICFGTLGQRSAQSRETIQAILSFAPDEAYRCFDINLRQHYYTKELIEESLYLANVFKVNDAELAVLRDMFRLEGTDKDIAKWFVERYNLRMLVLTAGASYSTIYTAKEESTLQTPEVQVADTVGAGDAFSGALIISLLKGASLKEAHEFAVKTAAYVCTKEGAWPAYEV